MTNKRGEHLDERRMLESLVDEAGLPAEVREHLSACPMCRAEREGMQRSLAGMGGMAKRLAPAPRRRIVLPEERSGLWTWGLRGGLAAMAALIVAIGSIVYQQVPSTKAGVENAAALKAEMAQDERFMAEIAVLEDNALPLAYQEISDDFDDNADVSRGKSSPAKDESRNRDGGSVRLHGAEGPGAVS